MKILVDSDEFRAWHEVGHATVCLHLGGDVTLIEFLDGNARGHARARCSVTSEEMDRSVACGGFATEFYLLQARYVDWEDTPEDIQRVSDILFSNSWRDHQDFIGRIVTEDNDFTKKEKEEFRDYAIEFVVPIIKLYFSKMQNVVNELLAARKIDGRRVKELLRLVTPR